MDIGECEELEMVVEDEKTQKLRSEIDSYSNVKVWVLETEPEKQFSQGKIAMDLML